MPPSKRTQLEDNYIFLIEERKIRAIFSSMKKETNVVGSFNKKRSPNFSCSVSIKEKEKEWMIHKVQKEKYYSL